MMAAPLRFMPLLGRLLLCRVHRSHVRPLCVRRHRVDPAAEDPTADMGAGPPHPWRATVGPPSLLSDCGTPPSLAGDCGDPPSLAGDCGTSPSLKSDYANLLKQFPAPKNLLHSAISRALRTSQLRDKMSYIHSGGGSHNVSTQLLQRLLSLQGTPSLEVSPCKEKSVTTF
ncbi:unnamed protein product [Ranitomeya imitator]|uniref:Uncharacterized protein n=1 Tax=Ranitomeya imitator TaxID=111125 RepID=A0ABN9L3P0_9NEOB|nr:unnamed protein product [Ranitomeya imitator]